MSYNRPLADGNWQTLLAWGRNDRKSGNAGNATNALLLESAASLGPRHTLFGRLERLENDELTGNGDVATVEKLSLGYLYDVWKESPLRAGVGLVGSLSRVPQELEPRYGGRNLSSYMVFLRFRLIGGAMGGSMPMKM